MWNLFPLKHTLVFLSSDKGHFKNSQSGTGQKHVHLVGLWSVLDFPCAHVYTILQFYSLPLKGVLRIKGSRKACEHLQYGD